MNSMEEEEAEEEEQEELYTNLSSPLLSAFGIRNTRRATRKSIEGKAAARLPEGPVGLCYIQCYLRHDNRNKSFL